MMQVIKQFDYSWFEDYEKWCEQNPIIVPTSCPDKKEGCAVYHTRKELRKPTYEGFKDWLEMPMEVPKSFTSWAESATVSIHTGKESKTVTKTYEYDQEGRVIKEIITEE